MSTDNNNTNYGTMGQVRESSLEQPGLDEDGNPRPREVSGCYNAKGYLSAAAGAFALFGAVMFAQSHDSAAYASFILAAASTFGLCVSCAHESAHPEPRRPAL